MDKGLSNFHIDNFLKEEENEDLKKIIWGLIQLIQLLDN